MYKCFFLIFLFLISSFSHAGNWTEESYWSIWGKRDYKVYLPHDYTSSIKVRKLPVVIALHGCMQDPDTFAGGTRLNDWADKLGFAVYYPHQSSLFNKFSCWNWFFQVNQGHAMGEAQLIMGGLDKAINQFGFNEKKVFLLGMSAGGAMASILANCYPNRFQALATHHGTMYKAATNAFTAKDVVYNGSKLDPKIAAEKGYACSLYTKRKHPLPTIIIHGTPGEVMDSIHANQIEEEMMAFNDYLDNGELDHSIDNIKDEKYITGEKTYSYTLTTWSHQNQPYIKRYMIENLGHAWSGGNNKYKYNDPNGPDSTKLIIDFFKEYNLLK